jgi:hypothetical protein
MHRESENAAAPPGMREGVTTPDADLDQALMKFCQDGTTWTTRAAGKPHELTLRLRIHASDQS